MALAFSRKKMRRMAQIPNGNPEQRRATIRGLRAQLDALRGHSVSPNVGGVNKSDLRRSLKKRDAAGTRATRAPEPPAHSSTGPAIVSYQRRVPRRTQPGTPSFSASPDQPIVVLAEAVSGSEAVHERFGPAYSICQPVDELKDSAGFSAAFRDAMARRETKLWERLSLLYPNSEPTPEDVIFMDIETTGLGSATLFLIGVMVWHRDGLEVRQYLARNYAEEAAVISLFADDCGTRLLLITFNGKSFDLPFIRNRALVTGVPFAAELRHFDLLHESRRVWKDALPNCKLQTLERFVCKRLRHGDIPGDQIADAYHTYVRSGDARQVVTILKHNLLDLVTLADLMIHFDDKP